MENQTNTPAPPTQRSFMPMIVAAFFATLLVGGGYLALCRSLPPVCGSAEEQDVPPSPTGQFDKDYLKWEKPLVAIVVSGQMHGYINPCGCSYPQNGGLERRFNFIQSLKDKGWDVVGIDLGEMNDTRGIHAQNLLKYELSVKALRAMNYRAMGIGKDEFSLPLAEAMTLIWDKKLQLPRPLNITLDRDNSKTDYTDLNVRPFEIIGDTNPKIGVINMIGPDLRDELKPKDKFLNNLDELPKAFDAFAKAGVEFGVILHHEYPKLDPKKFPPGGIDESKEIERVRQEQALKCIKFAEAARKKNAKIPQIYAAMVLISDSEPPGIPTVLDNLLPAQKFEIGHKGKYVGVIGVYRDKNGYRMEYQRVMMSPEWDTLEVRKPAHPIIALQEKYQAALKADDMLARSPRSLHYSQIPALNQKGLKATYVGSERCSGCHQAAHNVWTESRHAKAMETLENVKLPGNRHFDPECIKCHTTGFQHPGGYNDLVADLTKWPLAKDAPPPNPVQLAKHNKNLRGVGCENCHGPGSEHVKNTRDVDIHKLINPFKPTPAERVLEDALVKDPTDKKALDKWMTISANRRRAIESQSCLKCHDQENDVHWGSPGKDMVTRWLLDPKNRLIHHSPNNNAAKQAPAKGGAVVNEPPPIVIEVAPPEKK